MPNLRASRPRELKSGPGALPQCSPCTAPGRRMDAAEVLDRFWDRTTPVRVLSIANTLGVEVFEQAMEGGSGYSCFCAEGRSQIVLNAAEPVLHKRFSLAHQLGHFVLQHGVPGEAQPWLEVPQNFKSNAHERPEAEANAFALQLLLPTDALRLAVQSGTRTTDALSQLFQVSEAGVRHRLAGLGMLRG